MRQSDATLQRGFGYCLETIVGGPLIYSHAQSPRECAFVDLSKLEDAYVRVASHHHRPRETHYGAGRVSALNISLSFTITIYPSISQIQTLSSLKVDYKVKEPRLSHYNSS